MMEDSLAETAVQATHHERLPAHVSPELPPQVLKPLSGESVTRGFHLDEAHPHTKRALPSYLQHSAHDGSLSGSSSYDPLDSRSSTPGQLPTLPSHLSPAFTPPSTPGSSTPSSHQEVKSVPVDSTDGINGGVGSRKPKLLESLPKVNCVVRARIPT